MRRAGREDLGDLWKSRVPTVGRVARALWMRNKAVTAQWENGTLQEEVWVPGAPAETRTQSLEVAGGSLGEKESAGDKRAAGEAERRGFGRDNSVSRSPSSRDTTCPQD